MMRIALTFDDGPNERATVDILNILEQYGIPASFFLVGQNITERTGAVIAREKELGCTVECHSFTHRAFPDLTAQEMLDEVSRTNALVMRYAGEMPQFFRPPYIALSPLMFGTIAMPFIAGRGVNDWDDSVSIEERVRGVVDNARDGQIVLLHDQADNTKTVEAVRRIIPELLEKGARFCTVRDLFTQCGVDPMVGHSEQKIWTELLEEQEG